MIESESCMKKNGLYINIEDKLYLILRVIAMSQSSIEIR